MLLFIRLNKTWITLGRTQIFKQRPVNVYKTLALTLRPSAPHSFPGTWLHFQGTFPTSGQIWHSTAPGLWWALGIQDLSGRQTFSPGSSSPSARRSWYSSALGRCTSYCSHGFGKLIKYLISATWRMGNLICLGVSRSSSIHPGGMAESQLWPKRKEWTNMGRTRGREIKPKSEANTAFKGLPLATYFLKLSSTSKIAPPAGQTLYEHTSPRGTRLKSQTLTVMFLSLKQSPWLGEFEAMTSRAWLTNHL